jgi:hypothetical protein
MDKRILKLLYRSLDSPLKKKDQERLHTALGESEELRHHQIEIMSMRQAVAESASRSFAPGFAERLRARIQRSQNAKNGLNGQFKAYKAVFKPFAVATLAILVILIFYNISHNELLPRDKIFYVTDLTFEKLLQVPVF